MPDTASCQAMQISQYSHCELICWSDSILSLSYCFLITLTDMPVGRACSDDASYDYCHIYVVYGRSGGDAEASVFEPLVPKRSIQAMPFEQ